MLLFQIKISFNYQAKIIKDLAVKGSCIIVGRCADYILRDMPNVVKVFVWAPMSDCIKNVKVLEPSLSDKEAERKIKKDRRSPQRLLPLLYLPRVGQLQKLRPVYKQLVGGI